MPRERAGLAAYVPAGEGEVLIVLYINIDSHEAYTEAEVRQSYADDMAQLAADGSPAQAPTYEQWLEEQCDLGLQSVVVVPPASGMGGMNWPMKSGSPPPPPPPSSEAPSPPCALLDRPAK
jgi:hypothetical protein